MAKCRYDGTDLAELDREGDGSVVLEYCPQCGAVHRTQ